MAKRRYKLGFNPTYDHEYDGLKMRSIILNPNAFPSIHAPNLSDREGITNALCQWKGDKDGEWKSGDDYQPSYLKTAKERIESVQAEFAMLKQMAVNEGKHEPKEMPTLMQEHLLAGEARYDLISEEITFLENKLATFTDSDQKKNDGAVLKYGPVGMGKLRGGLLAVVDGQIVKPDKDGLLRICDPRSPYNSMLTAIYFEQIVKPWKRAMSHYRSLQNKQIQQFHEAERTGAVVNFEKIQKPEWPPMPEDSVV